VVEHLPSNLSSNPSTTKKKKKAKQKNNTINRASGRLWLTPVILAAQDAEIRRIEF
jgi:hypothetical protein